MRFIAAIPLAVCLLHAQDPGTPSQNPPSLLRPGETIAPQTAPKPATAPTADTTVPAPGWRAVAQPVAGLPPGGPTVFAHNDGAPGCAHAYLSGSYWQHIDAGDLAVAASPRDNGEKLIITVIVWNNGQRPIDVLPGRIDAKIVEPKAVDLKLVDPANLAKSIQRRARWGSALEQFGANMQTQQVQTQANTSGQVNTNTNYYGIYGQQIGTATGQGSYNGQTTTTTTMPNWAAQQQARENTMRRMAGAADAVQAIAVRSLKPQTVSEGQFVLGDVYFDRDRVIGKKHVMVLRVAVGDALFAFRFARQ